MESKQSVVRKHVETNLRLKGKKKQKKKQKPLTINIILFLQSPLGTDDLLSLPPLYQLRKTQLLTIGSGRMLEKLALQQREGWDIACVAILTVLLVIFLYCFG